MSATTVLSRFSRAVEAVYTRQVAAHLSAGLEPEQAHRLALKEAKGFGWKALEELRRRGLFPWSGAEGRPGGAGEAVPHAMEREGGNR